jgi:Tfp pilus assembly protein PilX
MKLKLSRKLKKLGSALLTTLVICTIMSIFVMYNLALVDQQGKLSTRSQAWNIAMAVTEAGIEDGIEQINSNSSNLVADGYVKIADAACVDDPVNRGVFARTNTLPDGNWYVVYVYITNCPVWLNGNLNNPLVVAKSYVTLPAMAQNNSSTMFAAMGFGGGSGPVVLTRAVQVTCQKPNLYVNGLAAKNGINLNGNNIYTDSYNSQDPAKSTNGQYDPSKYSGNKGDIALNTGGIINAGISAGNSDIYGHVHTSPGVPLTLGPNGYVGAHPAGSGIQSGWWVQDANFTFPDTSSPAGASTWGALPSGGWVVATSVVSSNASSSTMPNPAPTGLVTNESAVIGISTYPAPGTYVGTITTNTINNGNHGTFYSYMGIFGYSWPVYGTNVTTNYYTSILTDNGQYLAAPPAGMSTGTNFVLGTNVMVYLRPKGNASGRARSQSSDVGHGPLCSHAAPLRRWHLGFRLGRQYRESHRVPAELHCVLRPERYLVRLQW